MHCRRYMDLYIIDKKKKKLYKNDNIRESVLWSRHWSFDF